MLLGLAIIVILGIAAQWLSWRLGLPSILLLLVFGIAAGSGFGWLEPDALFGPVLQPLIALAVGLILYEGGLTLRFEELRESGAVVRRLVSSGALVTFALAVLAARLLLPLGWALALLLGAILVVTGPTVIAPLLRHIRPAGPSGSILKWEGIVIDPIGALLAVLIFQVLESLPTHGAVEVTLEVIKSIIVTVLGGGALGLAAAGILVLVLRRHWVPDHLENAVSLMLMVAAFTLANWMQHESGLLATTVMGFVLANQRQADIRHIVEFKENLRVLILSALFIILGARLRIEDLSQVALPGLLLAAVLIVVVRPLCVLVSTIGSGLATRERRFLACLAPRGIVAAAVASVLAQNLEGRYENAALLVPCTFIVIITTVAIYGLVTPAVARRLGVADADPQGVLFLGAHSWARAMAEALQRLGVAVLLVDTNRSNVQRARMAGLRVYAGSILADKGLDDMDLGGIGKLLATSPNDWVNLLAVHRFRAVFGRAHCYQLTPEKAASNGHRPEHLPGRRLFGEKLSYSELSRLLVEGRPIKATKLSEAFDFATYRERYVEAVPLFLVKPGGRLHVLTPENPPEPQPGDTIVGFVKGSPATPGGGS